MKKHLSLFLLGALMMSASVAAVITFGGVSGLLVGTMLGFAGNISTSLGYGHVVKKLDLKGVKS